MIFQNDEQFKRLWDGILNKILFFFVTKYHSYRTEFKRMKLKNEKKFMK